MSNLQQNQSNNFVTYQDKTKLKALHKVALGVHFWLGLKFVHMGLFRQVRDFDVLSKYSPIPNLWGYKGMVLFMSRESHEKYSSNLQLSPFWAFLEQSDYSNTSIPCVSSDPYFVDDNTLYWYFEF